MDSPLIRPAEFLAWRDLPTTQAYLQYLKDRVQMLALSWARREAPSDLMQAQQVQAETLGDLAHLECSDVREFYGLEEADDED